MHAVGISSQKALAEAVGVTQKIVSGWMKSDLPPRLRATSIEKLAEALMTHPDVITYRFVEYDPENAPFYDDYEQRKHLSEATVAHIQLAREQGYHTLANYLAESVLNRKIQGFMEILGGPELQALYRFAKRLYVHALESGERDMLEDPELFEKKITEEAEEFNRMLQEELRKFSGVDTDRSNEYRNGGE